jgi:hypothetical protein
LLNDDIDIGALVQEWGKHTIVKIPIDSIQLLVFEVTNTGHEFIAQQIAKCENDFRITIRIRCVFTWLENRVVLEKTIEDIKSFTRAS